MEAVHCFVRAVSNFQVQIADGGTMKCEGRCENVKLQMGDYQLKTHMFAIHMGGCDIVLGAEWLRTLGPITMDFQELYMSFKQNNSTHTLRGLQAGARSIISSNASISSAIGTAASSPAAMWGLSFRMTVKHQGVESRNSSHRHRGLSH